METKELTYLNRRNKRLAATMYATSEAPKGTALVLHGLGGWRDQGVVTAIAHGFAEAGYQAVTFDQADGANGPDADFFHHTSSDFLKDLEDMVAHIEKEAWYTAPLLLAGHSQGGLVALRYASTRPDVRRLALIAPAISLRAAFSAARAYGWQVLLWALAWLTTGISNWNGPKGRKLTLGRGWLIDLSSWNGMRYARAYPNPVLIVSAENDMTVATVAAHEKLAQAFKNGEHHVVEGAAHHFPDHAPEVTGIVRTWLTSS